MKKTTIIKSLFVAAIAILVFFFAKRFHDNHKISVENEIETTITVHDIQKISELVTASYYGETAMKSTKGFRNRKKIVVIGNGTVRAGFDLSAMTENDFHCDGDTLYLDLPEAKILDVIVNPKDYEIFDSNSKDWSQDEINNIVSEIQKGIEIDAINHGVLTKANTDGVKKMQHLLMGFGFEEVRVSITKSDTDYPNLKNVEQ